MGLSLCLVRCRCRACVTAPLRVASLTSETSEEVFCGLVCVAVGWPAFVLSQGFCRGPAYWRVPACMEGAFLEVFPVPWGGVVARATSVFFGDVDVFAGEPSGDPGEEW